MDCLLCLQFKNYIFHKSLISKPLRLIFCKQRALKMLAFLLFILFTKSLCVRLVFFSIKKLAFLLFTLFTGS